MLPGVLPFIDCGGAVWLSEYGKKSETKKVKGKEYIVAVVVVGKSISLYTQY